MSLSTHVLDTANGAPASGLRILLAARQTGGVWLELASTTTNDDGRAPDLAPDTPLAAGTYRLHFDTGAWFETHGVHAFYPYVEVTFRIVDAEQHHHVPLLLSPFGFSTYRGS